jgi:peptide methionine sulfoxide reductase MsrB
MQRLVVIEIQFFLVSHNSLFSLDGTHLGHNLPDRRGNRYCINLVSIAGKQSEFA